MPTFQQIYSNYNKALEKNLIGPDESLSDYAKKALFVTGDPSYKSVAEGGSVGNWVRQRSADLTNLVNSGPVDEWLGAGTQWLGDRFGIDQKVSRSVGESLPRMAVDFLPMAVGAGLAPFTGGSSLALAGLGATSALSAASAYEQEGKLSDALIGAASPYVGSKLSEIGGRAALGLVPKSQILQRLGFTGGTKVTGRALTAAEESAMMARRGVTESVAKGTTKSFTELDKPLDKLLHYVGGEALANVGFTGLDIAQQGSQAVFNRDYLFANLVSNIPFAAADLAGSFANRPVGEIKYNLPEAKPVYASPGEERAIYAASQFKDLESPEALRAYRQKYGLDIADISLKTEELKMALNAKESGLRNNDANFISRWNNYVSTTPEAQSAGFKPIIRGGAFGSEALGMKEVLGMSDLPIMGKKIVEDYKNEKQKLYSSVTNVVKNLGQRVDTVESLKRGVMELGLDEFLKTPVEERDYAKALEGSWLSLDGVDLVRDIHRKEAGLEPLRPELYNEFVELFKGKPASFTPDKHMELLVAASLARGQTPKFDFAKKKAQEAVKEGQADEVVIEEALKGMTEENKAVLESFKQPVANVVKSSAELPALKEGFVRVVHMSQPNVLERIMTTGLDYEKFGLLSSTARFWSKGEDVKYDIPGDPRFAGEDAYVFDIPVDSLKLHNDVTKSPGKIEPKYLVGIVKGSKSKVLSEQEKKSKMSLLSVLSQRGVERQAKEVKPQVEQTVVEKLIASIPAKWPDEVKAVVSEFYKTGDDAKLKELGTDKDSELRKKIAYRSLREADPTYEQRLKAWEKTYNEKEAQRQKVLNQIPIHEEEIDADVLEVLNDNRIDQEMIPAEFFHAEDWSRVKDQDGKEHLVPLPEGEFQRVEQFARGLMAKLVPAEMLPESSKELVDLAKLFNNPEVAYAELGRMVKGKSDVQFARASAGAFDFGMREVQNGKLIRPGKPPLGTKDGWMTELEFRVNGGDLGPLQKDEVAFYKQLVPEAFGKNSKGEDAVHLQKLWDGLGKVGEQVKVVTYGQANESNMSAESLARLNLRDSAQHQLETLGYTLDDNNLWTKNGKDVFDINEPNAVDWANIFYDNDEPRSPGSDVKAYKTDGPVATQYYNQISPFDTKKFPVLRVDVVLPQKRAYTKEEADAAEMDIFGEMQNPDADAAAGVLWPQDNLHENLPNTLGWAMVQIVPDPKTGEKVMFVGEAQSRWAQKRREDEKAYGKYMDREDASGAGIVAPGHPLLPIHQNLILKSVIKEAQKQGISKVAISDGETAMMTEGHDGEAAQGFTIRRADGTIDTEATYYDMSRREAEEYVKLNGGSIEIRRPAQEGGMRLAYDTTMPSIMSKLVGEGEMRDFGVHKNAPTDTRFVQNPADEVNAVPYETAETYVKGSPVFRNPDGTPKTNVTARVYDISNPSPRTDTLFAQNQGRVYGAASYRAKQILINSKAFQGLRASDRAAFVFAHEQSHISFAKAIEGKYGSQAKIQAEQALAWVNAADPQAKKNVEDVLKELHLGKDLAQMDGIRDVLNNPDPQEWLANVMGMYAVGAVKSKAPKQAFAMLPKPLREFAEWMVRHFQNLVKGAQTWMKLSGGDYQGAKNVKELFDSIRRSYRQAEWDAAQAERFLDIQPGSMIERGNEYAFAQSGDKLEQVGNEPVKDLRTFKKFVGSAWNKTIQPMHTLANTHEEFIEPVMAVMNSHSDTANSIADVFKIVVGEYDGSAKLRMTNQAFKRVYSSEPLVKLLNAIQIRAEVAGRRMITIDPMTGKEIFDMQALSPELRGRLQQFQPEAQQALVTMVAQAERANKLSQDKFLEADWQGVVHDFATLLSTKNSFNKADFKKAQEMAKGVFDDLKKANETTDQFQQDQLMQQAVSKLVTLDQVDQLKAMEQAQELFARFADLKDFYDKRPTFMSFRRFGNIKQRIKKGLQEDVIDAESNADLVEKLKFYKAQGWDEFGPRQEVDKKYRGQYRLDDKLLSLMQQRERLFKEMIENSSLGKDEKLAILSSKTASEALISEINSTEMYRPTKARTLSGDLERFDWWEQFQNYTPRAIAAAQRRALGAKVNYWMQNPALVDLKSQKDQFIALYEQSKEPDPAWARKLSKLNAVWHIGWNLPGHMAEVFQPMLSGVHELVAKGESLPGAMKMFWKAEKETMKMHGYGLKDKFFNPDKAKIVVNGEEFEGMPAVWLKANGTSKENVDIARMLHAKRDRIQKAPLSELRDFTGEEHAKLEDVLGGKKQRTLGEIVSSPFTMYANAAMNFYSNFTRHNGVVSMVTAYRKFRKDGLGHEEATQKAELFDLTINNSSGRLERPEMFGKLGAAGHLVYGLTSYVRGRFAQLATYYRHGFDAGQFEGKLSPSEIKSARKAFQTMILAQVGAAGVLGLPFIGAGIALMEDLLDEDIKGKMITALDDVTNDPTLTRVFTHGMMSTLAESLGVPADLHSRFALSSFLGTNSYDGISAKSFMGPSVAMLSSMFNLAGEVAKGESMEKALTVAGPGGVKRLAEALSEDYQRDNSENNLMMSMLGFRSSQQVKRKEWEQITRKQELETRKQLTESATKVSDAMALGPREARIKLLQEADKLIPPGLDYQAVTKQRQQNVKDLIAKVSEIEANKVGPQDVRKEISGRLAPVASQTAQAMGVEMSNPIELARALAKQKTRSQLGATSSQRPVRNAMLQDMQWGNDPWSF